MSHGNEENFLKFTLKIWKRFITTNTQIQHFFLHSSNVTDNSSETTILGFEGETCSSLGNKK
ncbi:CLUMA_CG013892, isoform A [Clunio marinus]|uniref:CLUMA_CG013892, isoform A n=1 Tax=Clunio marinus TaxID=568069 RepID=A0A1J1IKC9_9DIPT|nr:CLUMA_CG013892, isoform A [Clunio marinus]